jgi:hypothetical protein
MFLGITNSLHTNVPVSVITKYKEQVFDLPMLV